MPSRQLLEHLILELFSADELRAFVRALPDGEALERSLPTGSPSHAMLVSEFVGSLMRDRPVEEAFFDGLVAQRPRQTARIRDFQASWILTEGDARPRIEPSDPDVLVLTRQLESAQRALRDVTLSGGDPREVKRRIGHLKARLRPGRQLTVGNLLDGRYVLHQLLGRGGFGEVWLAWEQVAQEAVALKILHAQYAGDSVARERFFRGATAMADLRVPGVVPVIRARVEDPGMPFFVMAWMNGGDLERAVLSGALSGRAALDAVLQAGEGLAAAHEQGLVHRDVKPSNILLDSRRQACLSDFDLVYALDGTRYTQTGAAMGTARYAAPELLTDASKPDERVDVFGLAMTAAFCLSRKDPPVRGSAAEYVDAAPAPPSIKAVLLRSVDDAPARRPESVRALLAQLRLGIPDLVLRTPSPAPSSRVPAAKNIRALQIEPGDPPGDPPQPPRGPPSRPPADVAQQSDGAESGRSADGLEARTAEPAATNAGRVRLYVKVKIGLIYEFTDYRTLKKYVQDGRVRAADLISRDERDWTRIGDIPDLARFWAMAQESGNLFASLQPAPSAQQQTDPTQLAPTVEASPLRLEEALDLADSNLRRRQRGPRLEVGGPDAHKIQAQSKPVTLSFLVRNEGHGEMSGRVLSDRAWVTVSPERLDPRRRAQMVEIVVNPQMMPRRASTSLITVIADHGERRSISIEVHRGFDQYAVWLVIAILAIVGSSAFVLISALLDRSAVH